jgi:PBP superfamily domain
MKRTLMSAAVAAACAGLSGQALALAPSAFNTATANEVYISGASAQETQLSHFMRRVCLPGTLDRFVFAASGNNQFAFFCTVDPVQIPGLTKPNIVVYKSSVGGSGNGVQPVADATTLAFFDMAAIAASPSLCGVSSAVAATTVAGDTLGLPAYQNRICGNAGALVNRVTEAGFSDVEPALFGATAAQISRLTVNASNGLIFGVPVTVALRNALQTAQGLASGVEDEANMPSLTRTQVAAIYSGQVATWDAYSNLAGVLLNNAADNNIYVSRRVDTSGTQTSARINFLNTPCAAGVLPFVGGNDLTACGTVAGTLGTVNEGSGSGNVTACMNAHNTAGRWAVGVLSTEFSDNLASGVGYRFVKIDGKSPSLFNVVNGKYDYWMETTIQWRNNTAASPLAGDDLTFMSGLVQKIGEPAVVKAINAGFLHDWGTSGLLALPQVYGPVGPFTTAASVITNPVNTHTKSPLGTPNNCQPPVAVFPTVVGP